MPDDIVHYNPRELTRCRPGLVPATIAELGTLASKRFLEFFTANIRNRNTRSAYYRAVSDFFIWCEHRHVSLHAVFPMLVAAYVEELTIRKAAPTVQQNLAAIRALFDFLVIGQVLPFNPATSVRGPRHVVRKGKKPVLSAEDARRLLASVDVSHVVGLRDRALTGETT